MVPVDMMEAGAERRPGLRPAHRVNYKKLSELKLPKASRSRPSTVDQEHLYPVEIVEEDSLRYKVHYVGYSRSFDEWKSKEEIVALGEDADEDTGGVELVPNSERFMLYNELAIRIKTSLNSHRKLSPVVRIDMPFDRIEFDGGLRISGKEKRSIHGVQRCYIMRSPKAASGTDQRTLQQARGRLKSVSGEFQHKLESSWPLIYHSTISGSKQIIRSKLAFQRH